MHSGLVGADGPGYMGTMTGRVEVRGIECTTFGLLSLFVREEQVGKHSDLGFSRFDLRVHLRFLTFVQNVFLAFGLCRKRYSAPIRLTFEPRGAADL